ncbi:ABC transporter ATP-binding protein [Hansschlegelia beijingensis]|uniref:ATP-binding cassette subfamily B multidrug efflux pump n=1 Tax=Hansschlegelia beijingensis TaxID=1133344 RepID=A0A7W6GF51_9HYPH|nr:ABC transporter ATP-binding protein [Hansschlegelia beijingensis]MBB3973516.1 ATP-binding cassette subfamily B multidrug efflux pump [Hansschlegelia beijingensis]
MFRLFESIIDPTAPPERPEPPARLLGFYWHFLRQAKGLFAGLLLAGLLLGLADASVPFFVGRIVALVTSTPPERLLAEGWPLIGGLVGTLLIFRPAVLFGRGLIANQAIGPGFSNLIRWQSHYHVVRQSWGFFQNDFAGRIANKVMQTGPALRESVVQTVEAVWYIAVYGVSAMVLLATADPRLAIPLGVWFVGYAALIWRFVPRMRDRSRAASEARSQLTGRIVDTYTNILTVKLFARARAEDSYVGDAMDTLMERFQRQFRLVTTFAVSLQILNAMLVSAITISAVALASSRSIEIGAVAMAIPLSWQVVSMSGWVAFQVSAIFENVGVVQEGLATIARPLQLADDAKAEPIAVRHGDVRFERVSFGYGTPRKVIDDFSLHIRPGERIGLVGRSGAGKSTLANLLLRFFDPASGRILIDGVDIARATQESLREQISVVTQDTSLLHRSIRDNIAYGRPTATDDEIVAAAQRAEAHDFILGLTDLHGRTGYDAHVGERGVKLSGGQRQRVAIARVILKDAPIIVLDEATSALDSEVEAAIQTSLDAVMAGKTVIAVAHRLSTIARMDRLVVLDQGRIVEQGSHAELISKDGLYAALWRRQSGGFLDDGPTQAAAE